MPVRSTEWEGVYADGPWLLTRNLVPGAVVYGEGLVREKGREFRRWDANRSKLAAYLKRGGRVWPFRFRSSVLYLGAGSGTTASHVSDVCADGTVTAVEISPRSFRDLLALSEKRPNLVPILGDAAKPESYGGRIGSADILYQDVAQRDQDGIFLRNLDLLRSGGIGFLMVKARSADVSASPPTAFESTKRTLSDAAVPGSSPAMLSLARKKTAESRVRVRFVRADMRSFRLVRKFDAVLCMFGAFGYILPRRDAVRVLRSVRAHIGPSGLFIFEFWQSSAARPAPHQSWVHIRKPDLEIVRLDESRYDPRTGRLPVEFQLFAFRGQRLLDRFDELHMIQTYSVPGMRALLRRGGFDVLGAFAATNVKKAFTAVTRDTFRVMAVARAK